MEERVALANTVSPTYGVSSTTMVTGVLTCSQTAACWSIVRFQYHNNNITQLMINKQSLYKNVFCKEHHNLLDKSGIKAELKTEILILDPMSNVGRGESIVFLVYSGCRSLPDLIGLCRMTSLSHMWQSNIKPH